MPAGISIATAPRALGRTLTTAVALWMLCVSDPAAAQRPVLPPPVPIERLDIRTLAGEWFEVATSGRAWAHRRCAENTRFTFSVVDARRLAAVRTCTTPTGVEVRRGRLAAPKEGGGALRGRFVPTAFAWIPSAWSEYWVIASGPGQQWLLVGDQTRQRLSVWSRSVALDESALADAIAAGRAQGFDATELTPVRQPAGPGGLARTR